MIESGRSTQEVLSDLDTDEYPRELRRVDGQFEAVLFLGNISNLSQAPDLFKLKLSNKYDDWRSVYFRIHFPKNDTPQDATPSQRAFDSGPDSPFPYIYVIIAIGVIAVLTVAVIFAFRKVPWNMGVFGWSKTFGRRLHESDVNLTKSPVENL